MSQFGLSMVAAFVAALVGAIVWAALVHYTNTEFGIVAWGIGVLVGLATYFTADDENPLRGAIAVVLAFGGIAAGKAINTHLAVGQVAPMFASFAPPPATEEAAIGAMAIEVEKARASRAAGRTVRLSEDKEWGTPEAHSQVVWAEAESRWYGLPESRRALLIECPRLIDEAYVISFVADDIVEEWEAAGRTLRYPPGANRESGKDSLDYPEDVWHEARTRWGRMSASERDEVEDGIVEMHRYMRKLARGPGLEIYWIFFKSSFGFFDLLWFGLAGFSAYRLGAKGRD